MSDAKPTWLYERVIPTDCSAGKKIIEELIEQLEAHAWAAQEIFGIRLAMDEALTNAIRHGNCRDKNKQVRVHCELTDQRLRVEITDEGEGFDPQCVPDCTHPDNLERPCGRGIMLMRCFMSVVEYKDRGNTVVMEKIRSCQSGA
jgi:serine/threonine-protein kinase RsbW